MTTVTGTTFVLKKHRGCSGIRLQVWRPERAGFTTIILRSAEHADLMRSAYFDAKYLADYARKVSWELAHDAAQAWSAQVIEKLRHALRGSYSPSVAAERKAEAEAHALAVLQAEQNNAVWAGVGVH